MSRGFAAARLAVEKSAKKKEFEKLISRSVLAWVMRQWVHFKAIYLSKLAVWLASSLRATLFWFDVYTARWRHFKYFDIQSTLLYEQSRQKILLKKKIILHIWFPSALLFDILTLFHGKRTRKANTVCVHWTEWHRNRLNKYAHTQTYTKSTQNWIDISSIGEFFFQWIFAYFPIDKQPLHRPSHSCT